MARKKICLFFPCPLMTNLQLRAKEIMFLLFLYHHMERNINKVVSSSSKTPACNFFHCSHILSIALADHRYHMNKFIIFILDVCNVISLIKHRSILNIVMCWQLNA